MFFICKVTGAVRHQPCHLQITNYKLNLYTFCEKKHWKNSGIEQEVITSFTEVKVPIIQCKKKLHYKLNSCIQTAQAKKYEQQKYQMLCRNTDISLYIT